MRIDHWSAPAHCRCRIVPARCICCLFFCMTCRVTGCICRFNPFPLPRRQCDILQVFRIQAIPARMTSTHYDGTFCHARGRFTLCRAAHMYISAAVLPLTPASTIFTFSILHPSLSIALSYLSSSQPSHLPPQPIFFIIFNYFSS